MKTVILAGGKGSRLAEETQRVPKPMVEIGGWPILYHIMGIYSGHGFNKFIVAGGYKVELIKEYFSRFRLRHTDYEVDLKSGEVTVLHESPVDWRVRIVDSGLETMTGGRLRRLRDLLDAGTFMVTYGDGVGNVDITALVAFHRAHGRAATVTAVRPPARFGGLSLDGEVVRRFSEKAQADAGWINGGFFVFEPRVLDLIDDDSVILEREPLEALATEGELMAFRHEGFWQPMDTLREKQMLEKLWASGHAPWVNA